VNAPDLVNKFEEHVHKYGVETDIGDESRFRGSAGSFQAVNMGGGKQYLGKTLIIAMGSRHRPSTSW